MVAVVSWAGLVALFVPAMTSPTVHLVPGQVSPMDIEAPRTVENRYRTALLQQEAIKDALRKASEEPGNYTIDPTAAVQAGDRVRRALQLLRDARVTLGGGPESPADAGAQAAKLRGTILEQANLSVPASAISTALRLSGPQFDRAAAAAPGVTEQLLGELRIGGSGVDEARRQLDARVAALDLPAEVASAVRAFAGAAIVPNLILDPAKVDRLRQEAIRSVRPVMVLQRQVILRRGDLVADEHIQLLSDLGMLSSTPRSWRPLLGVAVVMGALVAITAAYLARFSPVVAASTRMAALVATLVVLAAVAGRILAALPWPSAGYLTPVAFVGILASILVEPRTAVAVVSATAVLVGLQSGFDERHVVLGFVTGMMAVFNVHHLSQRTDLTRTGVVSGVVGFVTLAGLGLLRSDAGTVVSSWAGLANGLLSSVLAIGLLPFVEGLFGVVSIVRLMELSNPNQPLLRRLLLEAPGTYHHSLMVGNLAEAAAEAVGADPVLCRTGALYHDVGKVRRPYFFVENQFGDQNPHDRLTPSLSTLIIMSHVKDGVELGHQAKLPEAVLDFIRTHHGTDLVRYFYLKAVGVEGQKNVDERDFRYPGPKPHTKETAIVMLADSVEASARALSRPTPGRVEGLVRRVIRERLMDGQFDESHLTLQELNRIGSAFIKVLTGVYHARIEYPQLEREAEPHRA